MKTRSSGSERRSNVKPVHRFLQDNVGPGLNLRAAVVDLFQMQDPATVSRFALIASFLPEKNKLRANKLRANTKHSMS